MEAGNIIVLFEDEAALSTEPLSLTRPVWELRCGMRTLGETIRSHFGGHQVFHYTRTYLLDNYPGLSAVPDSQLDEALWINGSLLADSGFTAVNGLAKESAWLQGERVVAFRGTPPDGWQAGTELYLEGFQEVEAPADAGRLNLYLWDLVGAMNAQIETEARNLRYLGEIRGSVHQNANLLRAEDIFIDEGCQILPGVVIDAESGPVILAENVIVGSNSVIKGPTYLGPGTQIKPLSHVRGSSLGEQCRAGGEVSVSIMQDFANKQHGGFLGHSYIGSWCNLGSGTETSNLKNNYTPVKIQVGSELIDSGQLFVGLMMGDHSKSAIGSLFNTGTVVGVGSLVFGAGFPPRHIPSYHWGGAEKLTPYPLKPTLDTARDVMSRRGCTLSDGDIKILTWVFNNRTRH